MMPSIELSMTAMSGLSTLTMMTFGIPIIRNIVTGIRTGATFVLTGAQHLHGFLPFEREMLRIRHDIIPRPCQIPHSAVAFNAKLLTSRYEVSSMPADANMWARVVFDEKFFPAHVPVDSAHHTGEKGFMLEC